MNVNRYYHDGKDENNFISKRTTHLRPQNSICIWREKTELKFKKKKSESILSIPWTMNHECIIIIMFQYLEERSRLLIITLLCSSQFVNLSALIYGVQGLKSKYFSILDILSILIARVYLLNAREREREARAMIDRNRLLFSIYVRCHTNKKFGAEFLFLRSSSIQTKMHGLWSTKGFIFAQDVYMGRSVFFLCLLFFFRVFLHSFPSSPIQPLNCFYLNG